MAEALITDLGRISALRVSSRSAVMESRGTARPLGDVVRDLHVDAVVEGGVQRAGDSVRVDLRLIDGRSGYQLWAGRIAAPIRDRFAIEDSVARSVAGALGVSLTPAEQRALRTAPTGNQQADELYLRVKVRIRPETRADDSGAIALLDRAVALDPCFPVPHAALAHPHAMRVKQFPPDDSAAPGPAI